MTLTLRLPREASDKIRDALKMAGRREVGGILMAEHTGDDQFEIRDLTVHRRGALASFIRRVEEAIGRLRAFFDQAAHDYARFNYIGEWHSHPSFKPVPSPKDDLSMMEIVQDVNVGANFAVLLVVKLGSSQQLVGSLHTYLPDGRKVQSIAILDSDLSGQVLHAE